MKNELSDQELEQVTGGDGVGWGTVVPGYDLIVAVIECCYEPPPEPVRRGLDPGRTPILD